MRKPSLLERVSCVVLAVVSLSLSGSAVPAGAFDDEKPRPTQPCWGRQFDRYLSGPPGADKDAVYLAGEAGWIRSLDAQTGSDLWSVELGGTISSNILIGELAVFVVSNPARSAGTPRSSVLRSVSKQTGITAWSVDLPFSDTFWLGKSDAGVIAVSSAGSVVSISTAGGVISWHRVAEAGVAAVAIGYGRVGLALGSHKVQILDSTTGNDLARLELDFHPTALLMVNEKAVAAGDERGNISLFGLLDPKRLWRFKTGARVTALIGSGDDILATSNDNFIYSLSQSGNVIWKRRLSGRADAVPALSGSSIVVTDNSSSGASVLQAKDGRLINQLPSVGPDDSTERPIAAGFNAVALVDSDSMTLYSLSGCSKIEMGGR